MTECKNKEVWRRDFDSALDLSSRQSAMINGKTDRDINKLNGSQKHEEKCSNWDSIPG